MVPMEDEWTAVSKNSKGIKAVSSKVLSTDASPSQTKVSNIAQEGNDFSPDTDATPKPNPLV